MLGGKGINSTTEFIIFIIGSIANRQRRNNSIWNVYVFICVFCRTKRINIGIIANIADLWKSVANKANIIEFVILFFCNANIIKMNIDMAKHCLRAAYIIPISITTSIIRAKILASLSCLNSWYIAVKYNVEIIAVMAQKENPRDFRMPQNMLYPGSKDKESKLFMA